MEICSSIATFNLFNESSRLKFILPNGKYVKSSFRDAFVSQKDLRMLYMLYHDKNNIECPKSARQMFTLCTYKSVQKCSFLEKEEAFEHLRDCIRKRRQDLIEENELCRKFMVWKKDPFCGLRKRLDLAICCWSLVYHTKNYIHYSCPFTEMTCYDQLAVWNAKIYKSDFNIQHIIYHNLITLRYLSKSRKNLRYSGEKVYAIKNYRGQIMYQDYQKIIKKIDHFIKYLKMKYLIYPSYYKVGKNTKIFKRKALWERFKRRYNNLNFEFPKSNNNSLQKYMISFLYYCLPNSFNDDKKPCLVYKKKK